MSGNHSTVGAAGTPAAAAPRPVRRIRPAKSIFSVDIAELWHYHELLFFLVWKNLKVRYKQTALGVVWALVQPLTTMVVFSIIFGRLAGLHADYGSPYPLFVFAGMLPWTLFASSVAQGAASIVGSSNLVTKVYFPRLIIPLSTVVVPFVDFLVGLVVLFGLFAWYGIWPHWHTVYLPAFAGIALLTSVGISLFLSALNVRYRDVQYIVPFLIQLWLYLTPVIYPVNVIPKDWRWLLALNPMAGVVDGVRWCVLGKGLPDLQLYSISLAVAIALAIGGYLYFRRFEQSFADVI